MRAPRSVTGPTALVVLLALVGLGAAGCATTVRAHGEIDPAATINTSTTPTATPTVTTTIPAPPTPVPTLDPNAERRITCLLITPSVAKAIGDWNNFVDHKKGTRSSVAASLTTGANTIQTVLKTSRIAPYDQIRAWANRLATEMRVMAAALRRGATPGVERFNGYKRRLQSACPTR